MISELINLKNLFIFIKMSKNFQIFPNFIRNPVQPHFKENIHAIKFIKKRNLMQQLMTISKFKLNRSI